MSPRAPAVTRLLVPTAFSLLLFWPGIFSGGVPIFRDLLVLVLPFRAYAAETLRSGFLPLWIPELFFGAPFLAHFQSAVFYPPSLLVYALPFAAGLSLFFVFHLVVACQGGTRYLQDCRGLDTAPALLGGIVFAFGGFFTSLVPLANHLAAAAWLPWILAAGEATARTGGQRRWLTLCGLLALQILTGAPETVLQTWVLLAVLLVRPSRERGHGWRGAARVAAAVCTAVLLSAIQLVPTAEYASLTDRSSVLPFEQVAAEALEPRSLQQLILPNRFSGDAPGFTAEGGIPLLWSIYIGIAPLALLTAAWFRNGVALWAGAAAIGLILALGPHTPLFAVLYATLPSVVGAFRFPAKLFLIVHFALAVLTAEGLSAVYANHSARRIVRATALMLAGIGSVLTIGTRLLPREALALLGFDLMPGLSDSALAFIANSVGGSSARLALIALLLYGIFRAFERNRIASSALVALVLAITAADLISVHREPIRFLDWGALRAAADLRPLGIAPGERVFHYCTGGLGCFPDGSPGLGRWLGSLRVAESIDERALTLADASIPNLPVLAGVGAVSGVDGFVTGEQSEWLHALAMLPREEAIQLLRALSVRWLIGSSPLQGQGLRFVPTAGEPTRFLYEVEGSAPRSYLASRLRPVDSLPAALQTMGSRDFASGADATVSSTIDKGAGRFGGGSIRASQFEPTRIRASIRTNQSTLWVVNDSWFPGWEGRVDDEPVPILRANGISRGILIPPGDHEVEMRYTPRSLRFGAALSAIGAVILLTAGCLAWREGRSR